MPTLLWFWWGNTHPKNT